MCYLLSHNQNERSREGQPRKQKNYFHKLLITNKKYAPNTAFLKNIYKISKTKIGKNYTNI